MFPLGVLKASFFSGGSAFRTDFTAFPFVDLTGRHTINTVGVVGQSSSKASFVTDGTATNYLAVGPSSDFNLSGDFDLTFKFLMDAVNLTQTILAITEGVSSLNGYIHIDYGTAINKLRAFIREPSGSIVDVRSLSSMGSGVEYSVRLKKSVNTYKLFVNNVYQGSVNAAPLNRVATRSIFLGGYGGTGYGLSGTIDEADFKLLKNLCSLDFESFPFVDTTGRHTISNYGVTQSGGSAYFNNPSDNSLARLEVVGNENDFNLQNDFDISFTVNIPSFAGRGDQLFFTITNLSNTEIALQCYIKNTGEIYLVFPSATFITSTGIIAAATSYNIRIERRGTSAQIWVNDIARATVTPSIPAIPNEPRKLVLGASTHSIINGAGINGTIDNFKFDVC